MSEEIILFSLFGFGYFITSIFATGGMIVAYAILGLFFDIKTIVSINFHISIFANIIIILTDIKSIRLDIIKYLIKYSLPGVIIGILFFLFSNVKLIVLLYALITTIIGLNAILNKNYMFSKFMCKVLTFIGGFTHGSLVVGGPTYIMGLSKITQEKSLIRTNITIMFLIGNIVRTIILFAMDDNFLKGFTKNYYILGSVFTGIFFGFLVHKKISQQFFTKVLNFLILFSGIFYLYKAMFA